MNGNKDIKRIAIGSVGAGSIMNALAIFISARSDSIKSFDDFIIKAPSIIACIAITIISFFAFCFIIFMLFRVTDSEAIKTAFHFLGRNINTRVITKNSNVIYPCLQNFLYEIIRRNQEILGNLKIKDISALNPSGYTVRNDSVFYRFDILCPEPPTYDCKLLREVLQGLITAELRTYGINGLSAVYKSATALCYSILLDRAFYDENTHYLSLELLYICTEKSAQYWQSAIQRDIHSGDDLGDVYDDQI